MSASRVHEFLLDRERGCRLVYYSGTARKFARPSFCRGTADGRAGKRERPSNCSPSNPPLTVSVRYHFIPYCMKVCVFVRLSASPPAKERSLPEVRSWSRGRGRTRFERSWAWSAGRCAPVGHASRQCPRENRDEIKCTGDRTPPRRHTRGGSPRRTIATATRRYTHICISRFRVFTRR